MVAAISNAMTEGTHLLVQAGTGTGKSLGYLAPALARIVERDETVIVATATLALQAQLASTDIPAALDAVETVTGRRPRASVLKGRTNYACLYKVRDEASEAGQGALIGAADLGESRSTESPSRLGIEVLALREWAEEQALNGGRGDRDDAPGHTAQAWQQVSIPTRECLGVGRCPFGAECFVERSRAEAHDADLVVTNHALVAINAMHGQSVLPEHGVLIIDEAHELTSRLTTAATGELGEALAERVARRCLPWLDDDTGTDLLEAVERLGDALMDSPAERIMGEGPVVLACAGLRDAARKAVSELGRTKDDPECSQASGALGEVLDVAERMARLSEHDVVWVSRAEGRGGADPAATAHVAPLSVAGLLREEIFAEATTILTSATLTLGGDFRAFAGSIGLRAAEELTAQQEAGEEGGWRGLDVGSPFDYRRQGILYAASSLPSPGRDGLGEQVLAEIAQLVWAAGGRTLGLFASRRNAEQAAAHCREALPELRILCQGDAQLSELQRIFTDEPETSLFGTMSLWQGVDVPGETCQLVIIDKIPFPRPDDPLMQARKKAVDDAGGNGFMAVAATHAALLLAQGAGRLIRRESDRGVVAILDPRLVTARYGSFLASSLPGFWRTTDQDIAGRALLRLRGAE
ncbi:ATP-dependent DNA helicase [Arachnia propionica]|uniref:ATP-dependent helicase DinG n=2 Tax=Arachnia propionica TaxID=1750 RepID=A0A3P1T578_9ACTN|nr:ATP-dependent DNA helicase [Arachnia propionica]MDO5083112.1 ATP-dependent DNA helicase [Arachnia propionica]RRD03956.1 ATP-dependent DNA helicase [Arachnia propionica]